MEGIRREKEKQKAIEVKTCLLDKSILIELQADAKTKLNILKHVEKIKNRDTLRDASQKQLTIHKSRELSNEAADGKDKRRQSAFRQHKLRDITIQKRSSQAVNFQIDSAPKNKSPRQQVAFQGHSVEKAGYQQGASKTKSTTVRESPSPKSTLAKAAQR